jgi:hypothetical protein
MEIEKKFQCQKMATDLLAMIRYAKKSILKTISHYQSEKSAALVRNFREEDLQTARCQTYFFFGGGGRDLDLV